jgi:hypothetical protein
VKDKPALCHISSQRSPACFTPTKWSMLHLRDYPNREATHLVESPANYRGPIAVVQRISAVRGHHLAQCAGTQRLHAGADHWFEHRFGIAVRLSRVGGRYSVGVASIPQYSLRRMAVPLRSTGEMARGKLRAYLQPPYLKPRVISSLATKSQCYIPLSTKASPSVPYTYARTPSCWRIV